MCESNDPHQKIAVIVISWNVKEFVGRCLESIRSHMHGLNYEVILVDNASADQTVEYVRAKCPEVRVIANSQNLGFAAANNIAVKSTEADILVFANPDTELTCDIRPLIRHLNEPETAVVFGRLKYPDGTTQNFIRNFPTPLNMLGEIFALPNICPRLTCLCELVREGNHKVYNTPGFIEAASGAFFVMKRAVFDDLGMFDEAFFVYAEETDLFFQVKQKGYRIYYEPECEIYHHHGKSTSGNPAMYAMLQTNKHRFVKKHYSATFALFYRYVFQLSFDGIRLLYAKFRTVITRGEQRQQYQNTADKHRLALLWELLG